MIQGSNLELALFSDVPELDALETLYNLNQENTPEVGSLSSVNELRSLIQLSALNFFVLNEEEIIGFIICFREGSEYHSPNYKFFSDCEDKFLYIDRNQHLETSLHEWIPENPVIHIFFHAFGNPLQRMSNGNHFGYLESIPTPTFAVFIVR